MTANQTKISVRESLYLDLVRALAAFVVVLDHAPNSFDVSVPRWGHQAVMVFFVLSGYVISYTAYTRENNARAYIVARLARLWSVLVPAMVLTVVCDFVGRTWGLYPEAYDNVPMDYPIVRVAAVLLFLSESWVSIQPLSNGVVWSLCCEFWYYVIFAAWVFIPHRGWRASVLAVTAALAGFKALVLLPIWLFGVALQHSTRLRRFSKSVNVMLCFGAGAIIIYFISVQAYGSVIAFAQGMMPPWLFTQLAQARVFWFDWVFGFIMAAHLLGARTVSAFIPLERIAAPIRWCAGISFAAYLFHAPIYHFLAAWLPRTSGWLAIALNLGIIALLGPPVEWSKRLWRRGLEGLIDRLPGNHLRHDVHLGQS